MADSSKHVLAIRVIKVPDVNMNDLFSALVITNDPDFCEQVILSTRGCETEQQARDALTLGLAQELLNLRHDVLETTKSLAKDLEVLKRSYPR